MKLLGFLGEIFTPLTKLVDELHTSEEEKLTIKSQLLSLQVAGMQQAFDYERANLEARARIIETEAKAKSWLTRTWRPVTMIVFLVLVIAYWFGLTPPGLSEDRVADVFGLIKLGLGGYVIGRSGEKVAETVVGAFKRPEQ